jgi:hypothetical protein
MKFAFVEQHRNEFPVQQMCELLAVSSSGFYAWLERELSRHEQENHSLVEQIRVLHQRSRQTYGSPRIHADLQEKGQKVSRKRVARLMREAGIQARRKQGYKNTTQRDSSHKTAPTCLPKILVQKP